MAIDPLTAATTFATLVSLISDFRDKHREVAADDDRTFLNWLTENNHEEMRLLLEQNQATLIGIKSILSERHAFILEKLQAIDNSLAALLSGDPVFTQLVEAISPKNLLSEQSLSILIQFENSGASKLLRYQMLSGLGFIFEDGDADFEFTEPRFIEDDFAKLVELGLLRLEYNIKGDPRYVYTRMASNFVKRNLSNSTPTK
jgi:hypothetical protein